MSIDPNLTPAGADDLGARSTTSPPAESAPAPADPPTAEEAAAAAASRELSEEVPVPIALWPSEIDERARVVEAIEDQAAEDGPRPSDDELSR
ncbi:MAG: hypothetical protein ACREFI_04860 [Stellaceae bacterium]